MTSKVHLDASLQPRAVIGTNQWKMICVRKLCNNPSADFLP